MCVNWLEVVFCFNKLGIHRRPDEEHFINETQEVVQQTTFSCLWQGKTVNDTLYGHNTDVSTIKKQKALIKLRKASTVYLMTA